MRFLSLIFICLILFDTDVSAEISANSCTILRSATSLTTIVPEIVQLVMRFYYAPLTIRNSTVHHREKRFFASASATSLAEQTFANTIQDVNFTNIALLILKNNETMTKIRHHIDNDLIIRLILHEINYEKLLSGLISSIEHNFDFEHFLINIINRTHIDLIHEEFFTRGTLPKWFMKILHPNFNVKIIEQISTTIRNFTEKIVKILSQSERIDHYLFNMITQQAIRPLNNILQGINNDKPKTFEQLFEIINRIAMKQQINGSTNKIKSKSTTIDLNNNDDVKLMLYQWSIAVDTMGQTTRIILKSLEQLYCTGVWE